ncbi:hypothetical protein [Szabonella alba]|uniref:DNA-binding protein n=1 Tax=Szabonella alba TaxID=2804194 RepID=A0A8K0VDE1_9RHOB|nr:hypothetical protein [Szabonella alba]MBL4919041.1 hypothetical protein [Szabonella alba]
MNVKKTASNQPAAKKATGNKKTTKVKAPKVAESKTVLKKSDLFDLVKAGAPGINGQIASAIMDVVLLEIGEAIKAGKTIRALPAGNLVFQKRKMLDDGEVITCKLRHKSAPVTAESP